MVHDHRPTTPVDLRKNSLDFIYDKNLIGSSSTYVNCGTPVITVLTGSGAAGINEIFTLDTVAEKFSVGPSEDITKAGEYSLRMTFSYSNYPENFVASPVFKVTIIDGCNPPASYPVQLSLTPPSYVAQTYTITEPEKNYEVPNWITVPDYCTYRIEYQEQEVIAGDAGRAVYFDG